VVLNLLRDCRINIGDFCFSLVSNFEALALSLQDYFSGFIVEASPDLVIEFEIDHNPIETDVLPSYLLMEKSVSGNTFSFGSGFFKGFIDLLDKRCKVFINEGTLSKFHIRIIEQFLYQVYYTFLNIQNSYTPTTFLIHASGVVHNAMGFVFTGPSGVGKSTVASLSSQEMVLNDETVIITKKNGIFFVQSTPFNGSFKSKENGSALLRAIFLLEQSNRHYLIPVGKAESIKKFVKQVIFSAPLLSLDKKDAFSKMLDFCSILVREVPVFRLGFRMDRGFWDCIDEEIAK